MSKLIKIKAMSKRNGLTILLSSLFGLFILFSLQSSEFLPIFYFLVSLCIAGCLVGAFKLHEPEYSFTISPDGIIYHHSRGKWSIKWQDVQRFDVVKVNKGLEQQLLPYIGVRLKSSESWLKHLSPRLASFLLTEQKELLVFALKQDFENWQCEDGQCPSELMYKFDEIKIGKSWFKGLAAMMAHRVELLRSKLGYDVYIPTSAIDREPESFVRLLNELRSSVQLTTSK